jgi:hypothetical protein
MGFHKIEERQAFTRLSIETYERQKAFGVPQTIAVVLAKAPRPQSAHWHAEVVSGFHERVGRSSTQLI